MATSFTTDLGLPQIPAGDTGWGPALNARLAALDARLGDFAVRETDLDPATGLATSLRFTVLPGNYYHDPANFYDFLSGTLPTASTGTTGVAAASATTYIWLNRAGTFGTSTVGFNDGSDEAFAPLARVIAGATTIIKIVDDRHRVFFIGGGRSTFRSEGESFGAAPNVSLILNSSNVGLSQRGVILMDASAGPVSVTLPPFSTFVYYAEVVVKKIDATATAVTVKTAGAGDLLDGVASRTITAQYGVLRCYAHPLAGWVTI